MSRSLPRRLPLLGAAALLAASCASREPRVAVSSEHLPRTRIAAVLDAPIASGTNTLYCASFELAWQRLRAVLHAPVLLRGDVPLARALESSKLDAALLDQESVLADAGYARDGVERRFRDAERARFGEGFPEPVAGRAQHEDDILVFAALSKELRFDPELEALEHPLAFRSSSGEARDVKAFGVRELGHGARAERIAREVEVSSDEGGSFVLRIGPEGSKDELLLARIAPRATLAATFDAALAFRAEHATSPLPEHAQLAVPKLALDVTHHFAELEGRSLATPGFERYAMRAAAQRTIFQLDETGAVLRSTATIAVTMKAVRPGRSVFAFDAPFLIALRRAGAERPYFALWVDDAELLVPAP